MVGKGVHFGCLSCFLHIFHSFEGINSTQLYSYRFNSLPSFLPFPSQSIFHFSNSSHFQLIFFLHIFFLCCFLSISSTTSIKHKEIKMKIRAKNQEKKRKWNESWFERNEEKLNRKKNEKCAEKVYRRKRSRKLLLLIRNRFMYHHLIRIFSFLVQKKISLFFQAY